MGQFTLFGQLGPKRRRTDELLEEVTRLPADAELVALALAVVGDDSRFPLAAQCPDVVVAEAVVTRAKPAGRALSQTAGCCQPTISTGGLPYAALRMLRLTSPGISRRPGAVARSLRLNANPFEAGPCTKPTSRWQEAQAGR